MYTRTNNHVWYVYVYVYIYIYTYTHTHINMRICVSVCLCANVGEMRLHIFIDGLHVWFYMFHAYIHYVVGKISTHHLCLYVMCVLAGIYVGVCVRAYVCINMCIMHKCMHYISTYIHTYIHTYICNAVGATSRKATFV
jgi:hypothetical protein